MMELPERLKSRKLWVTLITVLLLALNDKVGLGLEQDTIEMIAFSVGAYVVGQSAVDYGLSRERGQKYEAWVNNATRSRDEA